MVYLHIKEAFVETGWHSVGDPNQLDANKNYALLYNANLMKHVNSGQGTPLMPNRTFLTYIYSLFNENLKPNPWSRISGCSARI